MAIKLFGIPISPYVRKVAIALREKGLLFEPVFISPFEIPTWYREEINPLGKIPGYQDEEVTLGDSSVICAYLERSHPDFPLLPKAPAVFAKALWFEEYADGITTPVIAQEIFIPKLIAPTLFAKEVDQARVHKAFNETLPPLCAYLEQSLAGKHFLTGERFTLGDIAIASSFKNLALCDMELAQDHYPNFCEYLTRIWARPSFKAQDALELSFIKKLQLA